MAYIKYLPYATIPADEQVADRDNIIQIHSVNSPVIQLHHSLYRQLMYGQSPLSRIQREMIAVVVSSLNECHY